MKQYDELTAEEKAVLEKLLDWYQSEKEKKPKTVWDLKNEDWFYILDDYGSINEEEFDSTVHMPIIEQGNAFMTKEEAEFEKKRREVVAKVRKYARPFIPNGENWFPYCNCFVKRIVMGYVDVIQDAELYFESKEKARQAIAEVGTDDFKKYYFGVVEDESRKTCKD